MDKQEKLLELAKASKTLKELKESASSQVAEHLDAANKAVGKAATIIFEEG